MDKFLSLKIKTKLTFGIGLLFTMIVLLGGLAVRNITDMSSDTQNILADNYNSLLYSRRMLDALERIKNDPQAHAEFEKNLDLQQKNITEIDENVATAHLVAQYEAMYQNLNDTTIQRVRMALNDIMSLNMSTIYRKSKVAEHTADQALLWICIIAVACILIAFAFLIRLPRSITSPIRKLTDGILEIANHNYEKRLDLGDNQEFAEVTSSFNRMAERLTEYRKSTLADIIQAKKYIEAIVNSITEPIIGLDRDRSILFANDEALTILNLKRENVMGKSAAELALKNDLLRRLVRELIQPDEKKEPLKIYADDKESYFQAKYIPIHVTNGDGGETEYVGDVILLKNITEFKELDSAKTTFISTISHELKTPISAILMSLKLLKDKRVGEMNDEQIALADSIRESSDRLLEITGELLKMTQVETGKLQLNPKITKPIELIDYAIKANRVQAERFNCHIEVDYPEKNIQALCRQREDRLGTHEPPFQCHPLHAGEWSYHYRCAPGGQEGGNIRAGLWERNRSALPSEYLRPLFPRSRHESTGKRSRPCHQQRLCRSPWWNDPCGQRSRQGEYFYHYL